MTWHLLIRQGFRFKNSFTTAFYMLCRAVPLCGLIFTLSNMLAPPTFTILDLHLKKHFPPLLFHLSYAVQWRSVIVSVWWAMTRGWHWSLASPVSPKQIKKRPSCWLNLLKMARIPTSAEGWWKVRCSMSRCTQLNSTVTKWKICFHGRHVYQGHWFES